MRKFFTIMEVASLSGIKAHTLRIWEKRYNRVSPERTLSNIRHYNIEHLEVVLKLTVLNQAGYKISKLIKMDKATLEQNLQNLASEDDKRSRELSGLIISMFAINTEEFEAVLNKCIFLWGLDKTINLVIMPLMERVQLYSCKNCDIEFDFAITTIRRKIFLAIEKANPLMDVQKTALLFLPPGEYYDLLLLYYFYFLKSNGVQVLYMGTNVSFEKVKEIVEIKRPDFLITYTSPDQQRRLEDLRCFIESHVSPTTLLAAGFESISEEDQQEVNVKFLPYKSLSEFISQPG